MIPFLIFLFLHICLQCGCLVAHALRTTNFNVERITTQERCLDVQAFRLVSIRSDIKSDSSVLVDPLEMAAAREELRFNPRQLRYFEVNGGRVVQFAAMAESGSVVGSVEAEFATSVPGQSFDLPDCVHLKNLRVDQRYRRRGIASSLICAVVGYAKDQTTAEAVTLKVEQELNPNAVALYEKKGFSFHEEVYKGFMIKKLNG